MLAPSWSRFGTLALVTALVAACAAGPDFQRPDAPQRAGYATQTLPEQTRSSDVPLGDAQRFLSSADPDTAWWHAFGSDALDALVERAIAHNPTLQSAQAALTQAHESVLAQEGFFMPTVAGIYQAERHKIAANVNSSETVGVQANGENKLPEVEDPGHTPHALPSYYQFHTAELTVAFVPDVFGGNRRQVESLAAQQQAQRCALQATYLTIASNVVAAAIQEASVQGQIDATRAIIDADRQSLEILRAQLRLGYAMRADVAAAEGALAQAQAAVPPLLDQLDQTHDLIRALAGDTPNAQSPNVELERLRLPDELPLGVPARLVRQRPDVRAAEAELHAANAQVGVAVAAMLPQFTITGASGGNATQIPWMFRSGGPFWSLIGNVTQPLFQGGTLLHQKRAATDALHEAAAQYQAAVLTAYQNVADSIQALLSDADALAADADAERAARVTLELTREQLRAGYVNDLVLLNAQAAYQQTIVQRVQAQAARLGDSLALFQSLGGGWSDLGRVAAN